MAAERLLTPPLCVGVVSHWRHAPLCIRALHVACPWAVRSVALVVIYVHPSTHTCTYAFPAVHCRVTGVYEVSSVMGPFGCNYNDFLSFVLPAPRISEAVDAAREATNSSIP
jgi:hypothetical protein